MKPNDAALRDALVNVLNTFGIEYEDINRSGTPTLQFTIGRMTQRFSYSASSEDSAGSVRKLVNTLVQAGYQPREEEPARPKKVREERRPAYADVVHEERHSDQPDLPIDHNALNPELDDADFRNFVDETPYRSRARMDHPLPDDLRLEDTQKPRQGRPAGFAVYTPRPDYAPADVFVFEAKKDYLISKGEKIVIPIHNPELMMHLLPEDFIQRYAPRKAEAPRFEVVPEPQSTAPTAPRDYVSQQPRAEPMTEDPPIVPPEGVVEERPPSRSPCIEPAPFVPPSSPLPEPASADDLPADDQEASLEDDEPFDEPAPLRGRAEWAQRSSAPPKRPYTVNKSPTPGGRIRVDGINMPAQLGRIMAGIRHATIVLRKHKVTAREAGDYMPPADRKQIGARIAPAVEAHWIMISREPGQGMGYLYSVTPAGDKAIVLTAKQCYTVSKLAVPPFIEDLA